MCFVKHKVLHKCHRLHPFLSGPPDQAPVLLVSTLHPHLQGRSGSHRCTETKNQPQQCVCLSEEYALKVPFLRRKETELFHDRISGKISRCKNPVGGYWVPCLWVLLEARLILGGSCCRCLEVESENISGSGQALPFASHRPLIPLPGSPRLPELDDQNFSPC